eukprot:g9202.t1
MRSARFSGDNICQSRAFHIPRPCRVCGDLWGGNLSLPFKSGECNSPNKWCKSWYSGIEHNRRDNARSPWDMYSLKDALYAARAGTGEVADIIASCEFNPREPAFTKLISACGRWKDSKKAQEVFHAMTEKRGVRPNTIIYTVLISVCCGSGDYVAAQEVFENMKVTYNKIITASECGRFNKFAVSCFQEMKDQGIEGDRAVYCSALHSCIQLKSWNEAETVLSIMHGKGFATSLANYAVMINYYGEMKQMDNALNLFIELQELEQKVDEQCCHALMHAFELANRDDMAMKLLECMWEADISVEMPTYILALRVFAVTGNWRHSLKALKKLAINVHSISGEAKELILTAAKSSNRDIIVKKLEEVLNSDTLEGASASSSSE